MQSRERLTLFFSAGASEVQLCRHKWQTLYLPMEQSHRRPWIHQAGVSGD